MAGTIKTAEEFFNETLAWLESHYVEQPFFVERDLVWTLQRDLLKRIEQSGAKHRVQNDYPMLPGKRRSICTDIAILDHSGSVELAVEFKYEPSHKRHDILPSKFQVVVWGVDGVAKDISRIHEYVQMKKAKIAIAMFIDEGGYFAARPPHPGSEWRKWGNGVSILYARA